MREKKVNPKRKEKRMSTGDTVHYRIGGSEELNCALVLFVHDHHRGERLEEDCCLNLRVFSNIDPSADFNIAGVKQGTGAGEWSPIPKEQ